jgi:DUF1680 family protein
MLNTNSTWESKAEKREGVCPEREQELVRVYVTTTRERYSQLTLFFGKLQLIREQHKEKQEYERGNQENVGSKKLSKCSNSVDANVHLQSRNLNS